MEDRVYRAFACEICDLRFTTKQFLQRHYIVHTEDRNYRCIICDNSYKYKKGLNRHYKKVHHHYYKSAVGFRSQDREKSCESEQRKEKKIEKKIKYCAEECQTSEKSCDWPALLDVSKIIITSPFPIV